MVKPILTENQNIQSKNKSSYSETTLNDAVFTGYEYMADYLPRHKASLQATNHANDTNSLKSATLRSNINLFKKIYALIKTDANIMTH